MIVRCYVCRTMLSVNVLTYYWYKFYGWLTKQRFKPICPWCENTEGTEDWP